MWGREKRGEEWEEVGERVPVGEMEEESTTTQTLLTD